MNHSYVACDLGAESGRVILGTLHHGKLTLSEVRRFDTQPLKEKGSLYCDIPRLHQQLLGSLADISLYEEPIAGVSCTSWAHDYLLFQSDDAVLGPTYHHADPRITKGRREVLSKVSEETIFNETGIQDAVASTLFQLGDEKSYRLGRANYLLPIADGFNYLLSGVPRVEISQASASQLYNPLNFGWSDRLMKALHLRPTLLPPPVRAGTNLGLLRPEIARNSGLEDARVIATCSHQLAAALVGLPAGGDERFAFLHCGQEAIVGPEIARPLINPNTRERGFSNEIGYGDTVRFSKRTSGLWILDECRRFWGEKDRDLEPDVLNHLAISAPPFESLINPEDPRFLTPGDMPLKIQAFCKETNQTVPRKPGPTVRCVLESLALLYRKTLEEAESLAGCAASNLYILGHAENTLLNHFTSNALQIPVIVAPPDAAAIGNIIVQALALGHLRSLEEGREIVRNSFKCEVIAPRGNAWASAYERLDELVVA